MTVLSSLWESLNLERSFFFYWDGAANSFYFSPVGRLCEWTTTEPAPGQGYPTFEAFAETLDLQCQQGESGVLTWTPDASTPDLVYYQVSRLS